eukprot:6404336-Lingulodinium_polyedra.AAC.1
MGSVSGRPPKGEDGKAPRSGAWGPPKEWCEGAGAKVMAVCVGPSHRCDAAQAIHLLLAEARGAAAEAMPRLSATHAA